MRRPTTANALAAVLLITALSAVAVSPAFAAGSSTVSATVTPELISCSVAPTTVGFGVVAINNLSAAFDVDVTNDGNVSEKVYVKTSDALMGTTGTWHASEFLTNAAETYVLVADWALSSMFNISETDKLLVDGLGTGATYTTPLKLATPLTTAVMGEYAFTITFTATN